MAFGMLAANFGGVSLPLQVCHSAAGYYLGTLDGDGFPYSRESQEYWPDRGAAEDALAGRRSWTQRDHP